MKLKKIASLMLAGVMAVSMLAGCEGSANSGENNGEENQVVAASVADYANSLLTTAQKNVFEFKNSADLTAALQKIAGDSTKYGSEDIKNAYESPVTTVAYETKIQSDLKDDLDLDVVNTNQVMTATKKGTQAYGYFYALSGKLTEASAVQLIVKSFVDGVYSRDFFPATCTATSGTLKCDYTAEISAVKVTAPDTDKNSAWIVGIVVTQTATEVSNAGA